MKQFSLLLAWLSFMQLNILAQQKNAIIDVQHYIFDVEINDQNDSVRCVATIRYKVLQNTKDISFDFISRKADGKGMVVSSVTEKNRVLNYSHRQDSLQVRLPGIANDEKTIEVQYRGIPADGLIITKNKYNHRTFFADHWPNRAHYWLPCIDHPSDKASVEFIVKAPLHYQVISNGIMIEETNIDAYTKLTHYKEMVPLPMKVAVIGVADFAVHREGEVNNIPVSSWVYPEERTNGFYDYGLAMDIFPFFIKNVGQYGYKKLANVQSKTTFGGMENAGAIFYSENSITGKRSSEVLIAHEIAHQWFGNMATEADWAHIWLSEGFATYMAILYMENKYGQDTAQKMRVEDRMQVIAFSKQKVGPVIDSSTTNYLDLLNAYSYQKGGWVLHMLRKQLGDSTFWNGIRSYYATYAGKNVITDDFQKVMEKTSGKDLQKFFQQWLHTPSHPMLNFQWKFNAASKSLTINITQQQAIAFEFPLTINISHSGKRPFVKSFFIKDKLTTIAIPLPGKPSSILIDPGVDLLYEGSTKEIR
jgi:aminopeptidase N